MKFLPETHKYNIRIIIAEMIMSKKIINKMTTNDNNKKLDFKSKADNPCAPVSLIYNLRCTFGRCTMHRRYF